MALKLQTILCDESFRYRQSMPFGLPLASARRREALHSGALALDLILSGDPALLAIVRLSLVVSLSAVAISAVIGIPLGALVALARFRGREGVIVLLNTLMGLPPVVVGLAVYLALSRSGPLGSLGLLFTPTAMVVAQTILVTPIIARSRARRSKTCGRNTATN
jgi:ABC-type tungstate transport system substrate-binding protein